MSTLSDAEVWSQTFMKLIDRYEQPIRGLVDNVAQLSTQVAALAAQQGELVASIKDATATQTAHNAQLNKVLGEITGLLSAQQGNMQEKIDAAVAAARAEDKVAMDAALAELQTAQNEGQVIIEKLDAFKPDEGTPA